MSRRQPPDVHEMLKYEMMHENSPSSMHSHGRKPPPPVVTGLSDQYMMLDSFLKEPSSNIAAGNFKWNFMVQGDTSAQHIGVRDEVKNVVEIQAGACTIPVPPEVPYVLTAGGVDPVPGLILSRNNTQAAGPPVLDRVQYPASVLVPSVFAGVAPAPPNTTASATPWVNNPYSQLPNGCRLTVQVVEAGHQSYSDLFGARHHFEFVAAHLDLFGQNPNFLTAMPLNGTKWDSFVFTDPINYLHGITLAIRGPDLPIRFLPDVYYNITATVDAAAQLRFAIPDNTLLAGDRIVIKGFTAVATVTSNFGIATLNSFINRSEGFVINGDPAGGGGFPLPPSTLIPVSALPPTTFIFLDPAVSLANLVAATSIVVATTSITCNVYVVKRRIRFPIHMRMVVDRKTNHISL